jgi:hypothetical protein
MANMTSQSQYNEEMFYEPSAGPGSATARAYNTINLNRQPSRHFADLGPSPMQQTAAPYATDDLLNGQYDSRTERMPPPQLYNHASYNQNPYWGGNAYATSANSATMGASSRMGRPSNRRAPIPTVSS